MESNKTFKEHYVQYFEEICRTRTKEYQYKVSTVFRSHLLNYFGDCLMDEITQEFMGQFLLDLDKKRISDRYVITVHGCLSCFYKWLVKNSIITENTYKLVRNDWKKKNECRCEFWTRRDLNKFLDCFRQDLKLRTMYRILFTLNLREGELLCLRVSDVHLRKRTLSVNKIFRRRKKDNSRYIEVLKNKKELKLDYDNYNLLVRYIKTYGLSKDDFLFDVSRGVFHNKKKEMVNYILVNNIKIHDGVHKDFCYLKKDQKS